MNQISIAKYLIARMEQLGIKHMFGVAGNYTAPLLNTIAEVSSNIQIIRNTNEQIAGYAADGHARLVGPTAVYVTYSVGSFSAINAIAGSYTEKVPVLLINGAPTNKEYSIERNAGLTYAHTTGDMLPDIDIFRNITVAAERITNAEQARFQIDSVLTAMITYNRPVYLEIGEDVWRKNIEVDLNHLPELKTGKRAFITKSEMIDAILAVFNTLNEHNKLVFWAGIELQRYNVTSEFEWMINVINSVRENKNLEPIKFITTPLSKSVLSEDNPYFEKNGCVTLNKTKVKNLVGDDGCIMGFGAWTIGKDNGNQNIRSEHTILAAHGGLWVGASFFPLIDLREFIICFTQVFIEKMNLENADMDKAYSFKNRFSVNEFSPQYNSPKSLAQAIHTHPNALLKLDPLNLNNEFGINSIGEQSAALTYDSFSSTIQDFVKEKSLVVDAGFPLVSAQSLHISKPSHFVAQASWLSIGYSLGSLIGVSMAYPNSRTVGIVGDGAFQETCQALSDQIALGQNNVIFVLVNGIYGIEQEIVDPSPFIDPSQHKVHSYNILPKWDYVRLNESFGGKGLRVQTIEELKNALITINNDEKSHYLVEVILPTTDIPIAIKNSLSNRDANYESGEDEIDNKNWPPIKVY